MNQFFDDNLQEKSLANIIATPPILLQNKKVEHPHLHCAVGVFLHLIPIHRRLERHPLILTIRPSHPTLRIHQFPIRLDQRIHPLALPILTHNLFTRRRHPYKLISRQHSTKYHCHVEDNVPVG
jgi:hypothetical protein